jgi:hypothetical protein
LDGNNNWFYDNAEGVFQAAYMKESDKDKGALSQIFEAQKARLKELGGSSTAPAPAQTPTRTPAPAKSDTPKQTTNQKAPTSDRRTKAINTLTEAQKKALGIK